MFCLVLLLIGQVFCELTVKEARLQGWDYINLHCRNNDNVPVDWWILYKPPSGKLPWETGLTFSYISSAEAGKWIPSDRVVTGNSMLQHTLAPLFRPTYQDHLAVASYAPSAGTSNRTGSAARGMLLADELSGVWITHTVPGLPDMTRERLHFPEEELKNGHIFLCLSADYVILNGLARKLRDAEPHVVDVRVPDSVKEWLPDWKPMADPVDASSNAKPQIPTSFEFVTRERSLRAEVLVRRPGDHRCLYQTFAKSHKIVLDVYGHHKHAPATCNKHYSVRKIESISLNYPNYINDDGKHAQVVYVNRRSDRLEFAVSTAAHWQQRGRGAGAGDPEYWACVGSAAADDNAAAGAVVLCMQDYGVWRSFDILKIKEPKC